MTYTDFEAETRANPLDQVERMAALNEWSFERSAEDEITISLEGRWTDCHVSFQWMDEVESLHVACAFDLKVPEKRKTEVLRLLSLINEQMWVGHFDLWSKEGVIMFRHALLLAGAEATDRQVEVLMECAVEAWSAISRRSNSSYGQANRRARRWTPRCSRRSAKRKGRRAPASEGAAVRVPPCQAFPIFPVASYWSAPARWAAPCWKAGSRSGSIPRASR